MPDPQDPQALVTGVSSPPPLATSREEVDPVQLGALIAKLAHATSTGKTQPPSTTPGGLVPPQQSAQPVLSPGAARLAAQPIAPPLSVSHAQVPVAHIGAPQVGDRFVPPTFGQIMTSDNPLRGVAQHLLGQERPRAVQAADPYGIDAWAQGAGPVPGLLMGSTEEVLPGATASRGLYSRVDAVADRLPDAGLHPNKLAGLFKSGASQEELAYRKVPEFLASKGNQPVTRAELAAHLQANPAPFPKITTYGEPRPVSPEPFPVRTYAHPTRAEHTIELPDGGEVVVHQLPDAGGTSQWVLRPTQMRYSSAEDALAAGQDYAHRLAEERSPTNPAKWGGDRHNLPGGEAYREQVFQLPDSHAAQRTALQQQIDAKLAEIRDRPPADPPFASSEQYYASPQYARDQQIIAEHNALNDQLRALPPAPNDYTSHAFDEPNILVWTRGNERTLPNGPVSAPTVPTEAEFADLLRRHGIDNPESVARDEFGDPKSEIWRSFLQTRAEEAPEPPGTRILFNDEVQSDWHQAGRTRGYQTPITPEQQARLAQLTGDITAAQQALDAATLQQGTAEGAYHDALRQATRSTLPPEYQHLTSFSDATQGGPDAVAAWRQARDPHRNAPELEDLRWANIRADQAHTDAITRLNDVREQHRVLSRPSGVPDAPFKDSGYFTLAAKQQLLNAADRPDIGGIGWTTGATQNARNQLSDVVDRLDYQPAGGGDGDLVGYKNGEQVVRHTARPEELDPIIGKGPADRLRQQIAAHEAARPRWTIEPPTEAGGAYHLVDARGNRSTRGFATELRAQRWINDAERFHQSTDLPSIAGQDLEVGGAGMRHWYDKVYPDIVNKILKPMGGRVEQGAVPITKEVVIPGGRQVFFAADEEGARITPFFDTEARVDEYIRGGNQGEWPEEFSLESQARDLPQKQTVDEPIWFARLTPEIKARIRREGLPLLTAIFGVTAGKRAYDSLRDGAAREQVGTAPPVQPPPEY